MHELLADFPEVIELPVQWGEQDAFGHVNNVVYFRWIESARIAYFEKAGLLELIETRHIGLILASIQCDYKKPLTYPDRVAVGARVAAIGRTSINMEHKVTSQQHNLVAAEGRSVIVVYDYRRMQPEPVPAELRQAIARIEGRAIE